MKDLFITMGQMAGGMFLLVAVAATLNAGLGWRIGFKGEMVPADFGFAALFAGMGVLLLGGLLLLQRYRAG